MLVLLVPLVLLTRALPLQPGLGAPALAPRACCAAQRVAGRRGAVVVAGPTVAPAGFAERALPGGRVRRPGPAPGSYSSAKNTLSSRKLNS